MLSYHIMFFTDSLYMVWVFKNYSNLQCCYMLLLKIIYPLQLNNKYNGDFRQIIKIKKQ